MEFCDLYMTRQSCRSFSGASLPKTVMERIVHAGCYAPSACNMQPWHFYVAQGERLADALHALNPKFAGIGGLVLITEVEKPLPFSPENPYRQIDVGLAVMQMALAATAEGYASCIIGSFDKDALGRILSVESGEVPRLALAVGVALDSDLRPKDRLPETATVTWL